MLDDLPLMYTRAMRLPFWRILVNCYRINRRGGMARTASWETAKLVAHILATVSEKPKAVERERTDAEQIEWLRKRASTLRWDAETCESKARQLESSLREKIKERRALAFKQKQESSALTEAVVRELCETLPEIKQS